MMREFILAIFIMSLIILSTSTTMAKEPIRLVVLPVIISQNADIGSEALDQMNVKISRAMHIPLNGTLQKAEYISSDISCSVFQKIWSKIYKVNKKAAVKDVMKPLAAELKADFIVCTVLYRCSQFTSMSMSLDHTDIIFSNAGVEMIIFDNRTGELINKKKSRFYRDEYSLRGTSDSLALLCLTDLIELLKPRERMLNGA